MAAGEFFLKFAVGLMHQLNQVNIRDLQLDIAGAGLGGFHQIFGQRLKALGFLLQDLQVAENFFILYILSPAGS